MWSRYEDEDTFKLSTGMYADTDVFSKILSEGWLVLSLGVDSLPEGV